MQEQLQNRDYVLIMDKSGSMGENDCQGGKSRWDFAQESTVQMAREITKLDPDGITVIPFASNFKTYENVTEAKVKDIFKENSPGGSTVLAPVLHSVFADYQKRKAAGTLKANGEILVVMTDGAPVDEADVAREIVKFANTLSNGDGEYGIQFLQVGRDPGATAFLKKLDDDLVTQGAKWDIVDTKTMDEFENIGVIETLVAALND